MATAFAGGVHGVQLVPQVAVSLLGLHSLPQRWSPLLQVKSQRLPEQAGIALAMPSQLAHEGPQAAMLLSASQLWPQPWKPARQEHTLRRVSHEPG
jgi:hypothetical protein